MPKIYDIRMDELREVTQDDIAQLENCATAFGMQRELTVLVAKVTLLVAQGKLNVAKGLELMFEQAGIFSVESEALDRIKANWAKIRNHPNWPRDYKPEEIG